MYLCGIGNIVRRVTTVVGVIYFFVSMGNVAAHKTNLYNFRLHAIFTRFVTTVGRQVYNSKPIQFTLFYQTTTARRENKKVTMKNVISSRK